jgi:hypothetical protein
MHSYQTKLSKFLWIGLAAAILIGCGAKGKPYDYQPAADEMKEGPGLFTGEEGEFAVYDSKKGGPFWKQSKEESGQDSEAADKKAPAASEKTPETSQTQLAADDKSKASQVSPEAAREFQEFQEWKQEQAEFRKFQEWKNTSKGAAEYKEFLEWKEWKSYQEWKKQQGQ